MKSLLMLFFWQAVFAVAWLLFKSGMIWYELCFWYGYFIVSYLIVYFIGGRPKRAQ